MANMTFFHKGFESGQAEADLWNQIITELNRFTTNEKSSAKITASDVSDGKARGLIIACKSPAPDESLLGGIWSYKVFSCNTEYEAMYSSCVEFLNKSPELTPTQKYYSRIAMTNLKGHNAHLVLFWREML